MDQGEVRDLNDNLPFLEYKEKHCTGRCKFHFFVVNQENIKVDETKEVTRVKDGILFCEVCAAVRDAPFEYPETSSPVDDQEDAI